MQLCVAHIVEVGLGQRHGLLVTGDFLINRTATLLGCNCVVDAKKSTIPLTNPMISSTRVFRRRHKRTVLLQ